MSISPSSEALASQVPAPAKATWTEEELPLGKRGTLRARIYERRGDSEVHAVVVHFHGGAFTCGSLDSGIAAAGVLADAGAVVVSIDYPLAPERPFPEPIEAGYAALEWVYRNRKKLGGPRATVWLAGEEAGGNIAAALALMSRDRCEPVVAGQILLSPMLDCNLATDSLRKVEAGPVGCKWADGWRRYLARAADVIHPYASPGRALRLANLPATLVVTADDDPMRDEAHAFAERLRGAGANVSEARLPAPTGWPGTYMEPANAQAPWAATLRERCRRFLLRET